MPAASPSKSEEAIPCQGNHSSEATGGSVAAKIVNHCSEAAVIWAVIAVCEKGCDELPSKNNKRPRLPGAQIHEELMPIHKPPVDVVQEQSSDEDEDGMQKPLKGSGLWGRGPCMRKTMLGKTEEFADGFGLCSPGRWRPQMRRSAQDAPQLGFMEQIGVELHKILENCMNVRDLAMRFAAGKICSCPFSKETIEHGRELIFAALEDAGTKLPVREAACGQPFYLAAMEELLRISGDPDWRAYYSSSVSFAKGVRLGCGTKTPRVPAVFDRKVRWRQYGDDAAHDLTTERENYISAASHSKEVQAQFVAEAELGAMMEVTCEAAIAKYGERLAVASLGAIEKKDGTYRVVHDGTHGVGVNSAIRIRDQVRSPSAGELQPWVSDIDPDQ